MKKTNRLTVGALLIACAIITGWLERFIPLPVAVPGVKLGLANIAVLLCLYMVGTKEAFFVAVIKALVCGSLFYGLYGLLYSVAGTLCAFIFMYIAKRFIKFGVVGVSVVGAIFHNFGQLIVMGFTIKSFSVMYYMCVLGISGVVTGVITGIVASVLVGKLHINKG